MKKNINIQVTLTIKQEIDSDDFTDQIEGFEEGTDPTNEQLQDVVQRNFEDEGVEEFDNWDRASIDSVKVTVTD